jgi:hypothetical protein
VTFKSKVPDYKDEDRKSDEPDGGSSRYYLHAAILVGEEAVRVTFYEDETNKRLPKVTSVRLDIVDLPALPRMPVKGTNILHCVVYYDAKKQEILSINPFVGRFVAQCIELGPISKDGDYPEFKAEKRNGDNGEYVDKSFYAVYKIVEDPDNNGMFVGCTPRYHMKYKFTAGDDGMLQMDGNADNPKATRVRQVLKWTQTHGIDADMEWPEDGNALPAFEARLKGKPNVTIEVEEGFIQSVKKIYGSSVSVVPDTVDDTVVDAEPVAPALTDSTFGDNEAV